MSTEALSQTRGRYYVEGDRFVKEYPSGTNLAAEFEKATKLFAISQSTDLFDCAQPLGLADNESQIYYSLIPATAGSIRESFVDCLSNRDAAASPRRLFKRVGRALAVIHRELSLSVVSQWSMPKLDPADENAFGLRNIQSCTNEPDDNVCLHGDFGFSNVLSAGDSLWIIDPSPNYFMTFSVTDRGPREVDIGNMVACLHGLVPLSKQLFLDWTLSSELIDALLDGYEIESGVVVDRTILRDLVRATLARYLRRRVKNSATRKIAQHVYKKRINSCGAYRSHDQ